MGLSIFIENVLSLSPTKNSTQGGITNFPFMLNVYLNVLIDLMNVLNNFNANLWEKG